MQGIENPDAPNLESLPSVEEDDAGSRALGRNLSEPVQSLQEIGGKRFPFDDREEILKAWSALRETVR